MEHIPIFFKNWPDLGRTALLSVLAYAGFILCLRLAGHRTLSKMNVFDFVFVVALGSTLSTTILSSEVTLSKGLIAMATLIAFQFIISWAAARSDSIERIINGEPKLLFFQGRYMLQTMRQQRVSKEEVRAAIRAQGIGPMETVR